MLSIRVQFIIGLAALAILLSGAGAGALSAGTSLNASLAQANGDVVRRISPDEVRELLKKGRAVLVDVRGTSSYKAGHIKGALDIALADIGQRAKELPKKKKTIVTYCS